MGPPRFSGGKSAGFNVAGRDGVASMGPPRFSGGKSCLLGWLSGHTGRASMGPPRFSGGKADSRRPCSSRSKCFNGAAAFQRRKERRFQDRQPLAEQASMGPPRFSGGKRVFVVYPVEIGVGASMGPPRFSGGKGDCGTRISFQRKGFNGAAAFQRRKGHQQRPPLRSQNLLQWGRRVSAAERSVPSKLIAPLAACFNGAAAFQRRKGCPSLVGSQPAPCFNGAAAFQRRKERRLPPLSRLPKPLQWGRRVSAAESSGQERLLTRHLPLQWGRRVSAAESRINLRQGIVTGTASMGPPRFSGGKTRRSEASE